jgi:UDP-N-acetyl-D-glucosamine dehydrogenase
MESSWAEALEGRIADRSARVAVVGLGYVGLPLAMHAVAAGYEVLGIETDLERLHAITHGGSQLVGVDGGELTAALGSRRFVVAPSYEEVGGVDVVIICVPTPLLEGAPDLSFVIDAVSSITPQLHRGTLVALESTTWPGTTEEVVRPQLESEGLTAGADFALIFSPERIDPGNRQFSISEIPKVVGGLTARCSHVGVAFYSTLVETVVTVRSPRTAEMTKLLENTYRQVNIALANEFAMVADELDIDIWEVIEASATKPFGFHPFYPGIGIGGHCIAVDPVYLTWRIRELGRAPFRIVELAREVDGAMPAYLVARLERFLESNDLNLRSVKVLALGVTYKPNVPDVRESRAIEVIELLLKEGATVDYHDPFHEQIDIGGNILQRVDLDDAVGAADVTMVLTDHSSYDWPTIIERSSLVFDARGVTLGLDGEGVERL